MIIEQKANSHFLLNPNGENKLDLFQSRFYKEYNSENSPFIYIADLGDSPQWIGAYGAAFALKGSSDQRFVFCRVPVARLNISIARHCLPVQE